MFAAGWNNVPGGRQHHGLLWNAGGGFLRNAAVRSGFFGVCPQCGTAAGAGPDVGKADGPCRCAGSLWSAGGAADLRFPVRRLPCRVGAADYRAADGDAGDYRPGSAGYIEAVKRKEYSLKVKNSPHGSPCGEFFANEKQKRGQAQALFTLPNSSIFSLTVALMAIEARSQQLAGVEALAFQILAGLDVLTGSIGEGQLALGVHVDLGNTQADGLLDHVGGDAGAAMQNQRNAVGGLVDLLQSLEIQALPVGGVLAVDIADAGSQEVNAQISDLLALSRISDLAGADHAVLFAADGTNLSLDGQALGVSQLNQLGGLGNVLVDGVVAAVEHDAGEASLDAGLGALVAAVVQMQSNGNGDVQGLDHSLNHGGHGLVTGHVLAGALRYTQNNRAVQLLRSEQDGLGPLQVVDVELANGIVAVAGFVEHFGCAYQHDDNTSIFSLEKPRSEGRGGIKT